MPRHRPHPCPPPLREGGKSEALNKSLSAAPRTEHPHGPRSQRHPRLRQGGGAGQFHRRRQDPAPAQDHRQIGRASCRESVCQYVLSSVVAVSLKKKTKKTREDKDTPRT